MNQCLRSWNTKAPCFRIRDVTWRSPIFCVLVLAAMAPAFAAEPLTSRTDPTGTALNQWWAQGTAAGFAALQYENHDGDHSPLPKDIYPRLRHYQFSESEIKSGRSKGPVQQVREVPTIGNCSMSAPPTDLGSIPRMYYSDAGGSSFLVKQYLNNQLFIYPEHLDYDPGANGVDGYGDLYPANSACLLISQGSSFSDMPFVKAMLATAAAFRPEVQSMLMRYRILAPTLQAVFRQNTTLVKSLDDYFTGKAHPPVFDASAIDELKMVTAAQIMSWQSIPPLAFVEVVSERQSRAGVDWFELPEIKSEVLATTPAFVSRVFRSTEEVYEIKLSAARSVDTEKRPLIYEWKLLQGDPALVTITPEAEGERCTLQVRWHPPMRATTGIRTHRVDIGLFVRSPLAISAPAIVSFYMLPNEMRFFDAQGCLAEVCYEAGNPEPGLPATLADTRWLALLEAIANDEDFAGQLMWHALPSEQRDLARKSWKALKPRQAALRELESAGKKDDAAKARTALTKAIASTLNATFQTSVSAAIAKLASLPDLFLRQQAAVLSVAGQTSGLTDLRAETKRLIDLGVLIVEADGTFATEHPHEKLTAADLWYVRQMNLTVLSQVLYPGFLRRSPAPLYVDARLTLPKAWRDVLLYDKDGARDGWVRHGQGHVWRFDREGRIVDDKGGAQTANYRAQDRHLVFDPASQAGK